MEDHVMRVLQLLQEGKITSAEAEALISALKGEPAKAATPPPAPEAPPKAAPFMEDFAAKLKTPKIEFDLEHLGERISKAVSKVQPEKIVARVQAQLRTATRASASWGAVVSAKVKSWTDGIDVRPLNSASLPESIETHTAEFHLESGAALLVENPLGNVVVRPAEGATATVSYKRIVWGATEGLKQLADSIVVDHFATDSRLDVKVSAPDHFRDGVVDLEISIPSISSVRASTHFGDVVIEGLSGRIEAVTTTGVLTLKNLEGDVRGETTIGAIKLDSIAGTATVASEGGAIEANQVSKGLSANSVSGDVTVMNVEGGRVECKSVSGDVSVTGVGLEAPLDIVVESVSGDAALTYASGNVAIKAVSGDVLADKLSANRVQAQAVSGDVRVRIDSAFSGTLHANTVSGDVSLALSADTNARVSMTTASGDLRCDHNAQEVVATETLWSGVIGTGAGTINVQTISGDSHIVEVG